MIIKYYKYPDTGKIELEKIHFSEINEADVTYCCNEIKNLVDFRIYNIEEADPPYIWWENGNVNKNKKIVFCPFCGEKVKTERTTRERSLF